LNFIGFYQNGTPTPRCTSKQNEHFISGLMVHRVPFLVADLGPDVDPFILHLFAALAQKGRSASDANVDITLTKNMLLDIWKKFVLLSGTSGMTASTRKSLGLIREDADMRALLFKLMHETIAVGRAAGVDLPEDFATELDRSIAAFPPTMRASMANDLDAGRPLELDWLAGKVVALGRQYGVPTPAQEAVYAILKPYRMGLTL
jgi:2-dehydropantoate 2-reductase